MVQLSPIFTGQQFVDANGNPLQGSVWTYEAGSFSVPLETYTTINGDTPNPNPILLDSAGRLTPDIWLTQGQLYNLVLRGPDGEVIDYVDNVTGTPFPTTSEGSTGALWVEIEGVAPTFLTANQFQLAGNFTQEFAVGNRVRANLGATFVYGTVSVVTFTAPNTAVEIVLDGSPLTGALESVAYSQITVQGFPGDAGAIRYTEELPYTTTGTVGNALKNLEAQIAGGGAATGSLRRVWNTTGSGTFAITPNPPITSYANDQVFTVRFVSAASGAMTINVNGVGAIPLKFYTDSGAKVDAAVYAGQVSDIAYDGTHFIVLDQTPAPPAAAAPRGFQAFPSNGTFTTPAGVFYLKVTCVGGGGGGGGGYFFEEFEPASITAFGGGGGGGGAVFSTYIATTPGTSYSVSVGAGGTPGNTETATNATAGGTSSFGITLCSASGGFPGQNAGGFAPGAAGAGGGTGNGFVIRGGNGTDGGFRNGNFAPRGLGGGPPGWGSRNREYGGGGDGGAGAFGLTAGLPGFPGVVYVEW